MSLPVNGKPKLLLHVGTHKTGSSAIQAALSSGTLHGATYLRWVDPNHSLGFNRAFGMLPFSAIAATSEKSRAEWLDRQPALRSDLCDRLHECPTGLAILSAEDMTSLKGFRSGALSAMRDFLAPVVSAFETIGYLRPISGYTPSALQQILKVRGATHDDYDRFAATSTQTKKKIDYIKQVFPDSRREWRLFDRKALAGGNIVEDFVSHFGLKLDLASYQSAEVNKSLSAEAVAILACADAGKGFRNPRQRRIIVDLLRSFGSTKFQFSDAWCARALETEGEDLAWIKDRLGFDLSPVPTGQDVTMERMDTMLDIALANEDRFRDRAADALGHEAPARPARSRDGRIERLSELISSTAVATARASC